MKLSCIYRISPTNIIDHVDSNFAEFASEAGASTLAEGVIGKPFTTFIAGSELRSYFYQVFMSARCNRKVQQIPFRCDSPDMAREMLLEIVPREDRSLQIKTYLVKEWSTPHNVLLEAPSARTRARSKQESLLLCSICLRVFNANFHSWEDIQQFAARCQFFSKEGTQVPRLQRTVCEICEALGSGCQYLITESDGYPSSKDLLVFLHGAGQGTWLMRMQVPPRVIYDFDARFPRFTLVSPISTGRQWNLDDIESIIKDMVDNHGYSPNRIVLAGISVGGTAVLELVARNAFPYLGYSVVGAVPKISDAKALSNCPSIIYHGKDDQVVSYKLVESMVSAIKLQGGLSEFVPLSWGHDCWHQVYDASQKTSFWTWYRKLLEEARDSNQS
ncbi:hypothetical protein [Pseudobacteriovorax antillogorgiicola]|uniref:Predicted esterase n=1 Tax=Pseudobacteriovorax antillogorgiicola TaxID=1513793 RepID=A0A1Y6BDV8_9BACT|nr:hypothetical protein [Pseudobacteriovorax antillogorgiicola]TCS56475.1 putative esterase [Pseudobacteriovorax antillogorgiicola]SMF05009.1 Predicted esterase [Pseudobacteriovorax antillogorgiicola]